MTDQPPPLPTDPAQITEALAEFLSAPAVIVCIGSELKGDDGAGVAVAGRLGDELPWKVFDARTAPESFLMKVVRCRPQRVLLIDAVHLGAAAGTVRLLDAADVFGHPCRCAVLAIQPQRLDVGADLSDPVRRAVESIVQALIHLARARAGQGDSRYDP